MHFICKYFKAFIAIKVYNIEIKSANRRDIQYPLSLNWGIKIIDDMSITIA